ncbi:uncharacterized protein BYT42DRAFT_576858 [Radiomyces spectabilis]|uniref:uncharacterized protein n=1 Tax=Radiomyces spectabilis TaxID=64574 RepID=UPI00221F4434|nr:uncharacterized protein BYT42DRAFT_576858 [Radiomyces spectabilis]KAI8374582.1 hypothetical protein BYT42DRAFT_576858 [Radiomyces spectabilis]
MALNAQEFNIEMAAVPRECVKDVLRALLHSIFFHRLLVNVMPRELRVLDTTVSITDSRDVEMLIEAKIAEFLQNTSPPHIKQGKLGVLFYEKRLKKNWFQFSKSEELVCWEQWTLTLSLIYPQNDQEKQSSHRFAEKQLSQCLLDILRMANDHKEHIPSITTTEGNPFPYQIAVLSQAESWGTMIKRLLVTDAPTNDAVKENTATGTKPQEEKDKRTSTGTL